MLLISRFVFIVACFSVVRASHFFGGTVTWKPVMNTDWNATIPIMFTQSYQWRQSQTHCDQPYVTNQSPKIPGSTDTLQCASSSCGGFTSLSVDGYCTDFSTILDSSSSEISNTESIINGSKFCVTYQSAAWPGLQSPSCNYTCYADIAKWSLGCCVDLTPRPDELINTAPVATVISPIRVPTNDSFEITIPVTDADNDTIRCRWAQNTSTFDECGDICGEIPGTILDRESCTLTLNTTGKQVGDVYAVALMVEDFYNHSNETALSSVAVQFLIEIIASPTCYSKPTISSNLSTDTILTVGQLFIFTVTIATDCPATTIVDYFRTPPLNMQKSNITFNAKNDLYLVNETWTPTNDQLGLQTYCAMATDSALIQSDIFCLLFTVLPITTTTITTDSTTDTTGTTATTTTSTTDTSTTTTETTTTTSTTSTSTTDTSTTTTTSTTSTSTTDTSTTTTTSTTSTSTTTTETTTTTSTTSTSTTDTSTTTTTSTTSTSTTDTSTTTTPTSTTSSTSTTSGTTTSSSSSSSSTSTSSSTSSTSTSSTSSTTTTRTSTTTSTSSTTTTTTTTAEQSVTVIVQIPDETTNNAGFIGLALGLGIPLLAALSGLIYYSCCRRKCSSQKYVNSQSDNRFVQGNPTPTESNETSNDSKDKNKPIENKQPDYRTEYIKIGNNENQTILPVEEPPSAPENSFACISISDFELTTLNATTTSFFSPSTNTFPNDDVQQIQETTKHTILSNPIGSILVRAYSQQEKNKLLNSQ